MAIDAIVLSELRTTAKELALSKLLPSSLGGQPANVLAVILRGHELGIGPMTSMSMFHVIQGVVSMSSQGIGALITGHPDCEYLTPIEFTDKIATFETKRRGSPKTVTMSYTIEEAERAGLLNKDNWKKDPVAMLLARSRARIGRAVYPDRMLGIYDRDSGELDDLKDVTPSSNQAAHVQSVKDAIRAQVTEVRASAAVSSAVERFATAVGPAVTDAEFTEESWEDKINGATSADALKAMLPALQALPPERAALLKPLFNARRAVLVINAP